MVPNELLNGWFYPHLESLLECCSVQWLGCVKNRCSDLGPFGFIVSQEEKFKLIKSHYNKLEVNTIVIGVLVSLIMSVMIKVKQKNN